MAPDIVENKRWIVFFEIGQAVHTYSSVVSLAVFIPTLFPRPPGLFPPLSYGHCAWKCSGLHYRQIPEKLPVLSHHSPSLQAHPHHRLHGWFEQGGSAPG